MHYILVMPLRFDTQLEDVRVLRKRIDTDFSFHPGDAVKIPGDFEVCVAKVLVGVEVLLVADYATVYFDPIFDDEAQVLIAAGWAASNK